MLRHTSSAALVTTLTLVASLPAPSSSAAQVPSPEDAFGFPPGADYQVAGYDEMLAYFSALADASDRVRMEEIGRSARGRPLVLLYISSPDNLERLDHWKSITARLARARVDETEARRLANEGRAVVWVDGGMDDQEYATAQMTPELAYRLATSEEEEIRTIREQVVVLLNPVLNPDGVANDVSWYREVRGTPWETTRPPRLGQPWAGTDNNRDWFMNNMPETRAVSRILYREWYPQIVYNHHQPAPEFARIFIPPFADPVNPDIHPAVTTGVNMVGAAMAARFAQLGMPGYVSRSVYSMWWNGGMRLTPYFHNMVGLLTETAHRSPTPRVYDPEEFPLTLSVRRGLASRTDSTSISYPDPWFGTESHIRDAFDYMHEATIATLDLAARYRERFLLSQWRMGRDAIEAGQAGAPFAYVVPPDQWDPVEAVNLVNVLRRSGVEVHRAVEDLTVDGRAFPSGSYIVYASQAFRPHVVNLMERRAYPERQQYPGGPPETPYDLAGWTLPLQMGVRTARVDRPFEIRTEEVGELATMEPGSVTGSGRAGYALAPTSNAAYRAINRLLAAGHAVSVVDDPLGDGMPAGTFLVQAAPGVRDEVTSLAHDLGVSFIGLDARPGAPSVPLRQPRVGLYKAWHSRVDDQGWSLWVLEEHGFAVDTLHDADIRGQDLTRYDVIVLPNQPGQEILLGNLPGTMPEAFVGGIGAEGAAALKRFVEAGGTLIAFDEATDLPIDQFGLPVRNAVAGLDPQQFFIPGSLIRAVVDTDHPLGAGMQEEVATAFSQSRAFSVVTLPRRGEGGIEETLPPPEPDVDVVVRYATDDLLLSGWAMGEEQYLAGRAGMVRVGLGRGSVVLFGFRPQFRGQPRGTYKLLFNALMRGAVRERRTAS
jgi:hypothetical protein